MMTNTANVYPLRENESWGLAKARVVSACGREARVEMAGVVRDAEVAFSCLVQPLPGDLVVLGGDRSGTYHVLGIIERPGVEKGMTLAFPAGATLVAASGPLNLVSEESVSITSGDRLGLVSRRVVHKSDEAVVDYGDLTARGETLRATYKSVLLVSRVLSTMARHALSRVKNYVRKTEDSDQVQAGNISRKTGGLYSMDSARTIMVSKKETKIDGEHIFMG